MGLSAEAGLGRWLLESSESHNHRFFSSYGTMSDDHNRLQESLNSCHALPHTRTPPYCSLGEGKGLANAETVRWITFDRILDGPARARKRLYNSAS